jgi:hypothetical protein
MQREPQRRPDSSLAGTHRGASTMKDRGDGISSSQASATGLLQLLSSGRGSRRDDDHDGDHYQDGISSEADV